MSEFLNRIDVQRKVIKLVNTTRYKFQISGLSISSIERWAVENGLDKSDDIVQLLLLISSKLFFLSNKSQEQITDEYENLSSDINENIRNLESIIEHIKTGQNQD